jgi:uncharacterized protein
MNNKTLSIVIHDVAPATFNNVREIIKDVRAAGFGHIVLLIVHDYHDLPVTDSALEEYTGYLREVAKDGFEICLHGYRHIVSEVEGGAVQKFMGTVYTRNEGEFYQLTEEQADGLIKTGNAKLRALGFKPTGFVPPAWLISDAAMTALEKNDFTYTTRLHNLIPLGGDRGKITAPSLVWSVQKRWRVLVSLVYNFTVRQYLKMRNYSIIRINIHPPDWDHKAIRTQILKSIAVLSRNRQCRTYSEFLETYKSPE